MFRKHTDILVKGCNKSFINEVIRTLFESEEEFEGRDKKKDDKRNRGYGCNGMNGSTLNKRINGSAIYCVRFFVEWMMLCDIL